jgi:glutamate racemase
MNIGIFDFDIQGVLLLKTLAKELSQYDYVFYADTAHQVDGAAVSETGISHITNAFDELVKRECVIVIIANDIASVHVLTTLRASYPNLHIMSVEGAVRKLLEYLQTYPEVAATLVGTGKREIVLTEHSSTYDQRIAEYLGGSFIKTED